MESIQTDRCVRVVVRITKPCLDSTIEEVRIIASMSSKISPNWRLEETQKANFIGFNQFFLEIALPKDCVMRYKLMVLHAKNRIVLHMEDFERELCLKGVPVLLEMKYNEPKIYLRELKSWLTKSGAPVNISVHTPSLSTFDPKPRGWDMSEDVEEAECHKTEYFAVDGKVACSIRSPPKTAKPDFTTSTRTSKKYCAKHRKLIEAKKGDKKADKGGSNKNADDGKDKGVQVNCGVDVGGNKCQCKSGGGNDDKCASGPKVVSGRHEGVVISQAFQINYADENGKVNSISIGNEVIDAKQTDKNVTDKDGNVPDNNAKGHKEKSETQDDAVSSPGRVFGHYDCVTISCGYTIKTSDETITIPPSIVRDEKPRSPVVHDYTPMSRVICGEKPIQTPDDCSQESLLLQLDLNGNEMTKDLKDLVVEDMYSFVKKCLKYVLPVGVVGGLGALGTYLWFRK